MSEINIYCKYDELVNPKSLKNHPKNRNKHGQDQIDRLAELYQYHGIRHPIIVSKLSGCIVAGHGRKLAALRAGIKEMPVVYQDFESSEAEYAFIQADNAIALWAELDLSAINTDLADLGPDFNIDMLGIRDFKLDLNEEVEGHSDPDEVPEDVPTKAKLGDLYLLGNHRLLCGDSTDLATVERLMNGEKADMVFTSPPYNIGKNGFEEQGKYENDSDDKNDFHQFLNEFIDCWRSVSLYQFINLQFVSGNKIELIKWLDEQKEYFVDLIACPKDSTLPALEKNILNADFEMVFIFGESNRTRHLKLGKDFRGTVSNVIKMKRNRQKIDRKSTRLNSSHIPLSRMPSSA